MSSPIFPLNRFVLLVSYLEKIGGETDPLVTPRCLHFPIKITVRSNDKLIWFTAPVSQSRLSLRLI